MIECSLCEMPFDETDALIDKRIERHERFHFNCKAEKRNTTEGKVDWITL